MRTREQIISEHVRHIERLKVMRAFADDNPDYADSERDSLDRDIRTARRVIVDELTNNELIALKERGLQPEQALQVLREATSEPEPEGIFKVVAGLQKAQARAIQDQRYRHIHSVEKTAEVMVGPVSLEEMGKRDRREIAARLVMPTKANTVETTIGDVVMNHRRDYQK